MTPRQARAFADRVEAELPESSIDSLRYQAALYRQLMRRRRLRASELALLHATEAMLADKSDELVVGLLLRAVTELERETRRVGDGASAPEGDDDEQSRPDRPSRHRRQKVAL